MDKKILDQMYAQIPKIERLQLRYLAKLLGNKTETEIRKYVVENWQTRQRAWDPDESEK